MPDELSSDSFLAATLMLNTNDASLPGLLVRALLTLAGVCGRSGVARGVEICSWIYPIARRV